MNSTLLEDLEIQELIQKLIDSHEDVKKLVETLLGNEGKVYTKKGRLNKSGACRVLGWKTKRLEDTLQYCQEVLHLDLDFELAEPTT
ncbi:MAG: hypothetical protein ACW99G_14560 [Candidatus Thorarchaeota archaeon]|jgi:hypothetical protein